MNDDMVVTTPTNPTALWAQARNGFLTTEAAIVAIIDTGPTAWEPLGYASFAEAWRAELVGVRLATDFLKATVVYEFFRHGMTDQDIIDASPDGAGFGISTVRRLREQRDLGVPACAATTSVRVPRTAPRPPPSGPTSGRTPASQGGSIRT